MLFFRRIALFLGNIQLQAQASIRAWSRGEEKIPRQPLLRMPSSFGPEAERMIG